MGERWLSKQRYVFLARQKKKNSVCVTVTMLTDDASRFAYTKLKSGGVLLMFFGCEIIDKHFSCYSCQKVTVKGNVYGRKSKVSSSPSKNFSIFYLTLTVYGKSLVYG